MNEDLLNVMGSFSETALDSIEKQNEEIKQLEQENKQLKDIINKAIEYIENDLQSFLYSIEYKKLLEILKGE